MQKVPGKAAKNFVSASAPTINNDISQGFGYFSHWYDTINDVVYVCTNPSLGAAQWKTSGALAKQDRKWSASDTSPGDGSLASGSTVSVRPVGAVRVFVNGVGVYVADGPSEQATSACYFTDPLNTVVRAVDGVEAGDSLRWNGSVAGFELGVNDRIMVLYEV